MSEQTFRVYKFVPYEEGEYSVAHMSAEELDALVADGTAVLRMAHGVLLDAPKAYWNLGLNVVGLSSTDFARYKRHCLE